MENMQNTAIPKDKDKVIPTKTPIIFHLNLWQKPTNPNQPAKQKFKRTTKLTHVPAPKESQAKIIPSKPIAKQETQVKKNCTTKTNQPDPNTKNTRRQNNQYNHQGKSTQNLNTKDGTQEVNTTTT